MATPSAPIRPGEWEGSRTGGRSRPPDFDPCSPGDDDIPSLRAERDRLDRAHRAMNVAMDSYCDSRAADPADTPTQLVIALPSVTRTEP